MPNLFLYSTLFMLTLVFMYFRILAGKPSQTPSTNASATLRLHQVRIVCSAVSYLTTRKLGFTLLKLITCGSHNIARKT